MPEAQLVVRAKGADDTGEVSQVETVKQKWAEKSPNQGSTLLREGGGKVLRKAEKLGRTVSSDAKKEEKLQSETVEGVENQRMQEELYKCLIRNHRYVYLRKQMWKWKIYTVFLGHLCMSSISSAQQVFDKQFFKY